MTKNSSFSRYNPDYWKRKCKRQTTVELTSDKGMLLLKTPYHRDFLPAFKALFNSVSERSYDGEGGWYFHPRYADRVVQLVQKYYQTKLTVPPVAQAPVLEHRLRLAYIGICRQRDDGKNWSYGLELDELEAALGANREKMNWRIMFPQSVLEAWFDGKPLTRDTPTEGGNPAYIASMYRRLGLQGPTDDPQEIQRAYRQAAKTWHPDVCKEDPDVATEAFHAIQEAYDILSDERERLKYDIGLSIEQSLLVQPRKKKKRNTWMWMVDADYVPVRRCGLVTALAVEQGGKTIVQEIKAWQDLTRKGRTLMSTWGYDKSAQKPEPYPTLLWL